MALRVRGVTRVWRRVLSAAAGVAIAVGVAPLSARAQAAADDLQTLPGFRVERVLVADKAANGSWINMAVDAKGRLLLGGQRKQPVTRVTLENGKAVKTEILKLPISETMGLLVVDGVLYVNGAGPGPNGKEVYGLFKCTDTTGSDQYDKVEFLREWQGGAGEHGAHGIVLGPDKKLYIVCGNFVGVPGDLAPTSPHKNYADDLALPRAEDGNGFGAGKKPPGGYVVRVGLDGKNAELFASGERNTYDVAFNADGELFGFDSDMEWDWGTPWYRPIRVFHAPSGADQGFREGTAKWPTYYHDSLPAAVDIGIGCPTGVAFGYGAKFPAKYQKAYYILDWTYGRLIAVHLKPDGASYGGSWENFVAPKGLEGKGKKVPLNLTDVVIAPDGAMYFTIGGRNTAAALYRVTYTGNEPTAAADTHDADGADARKLRKSLEAFHGRTDPKAVETAWPHLDSADRFVRYAARIAIEAQPVEQWRSLALAEAKPRAALTALLSVARLGGKDAQADVFRALEKLQANALPPEQLIEKLRVIEVSVARNGKPAVDVAKAAVAELSPLYPAKDVALNRELCQVLLALEAPDAVGKTVGLLKAAKTQGEQLNYVLALRTVTTGWTPELRREYFTWWTQDRKGAAHPDYVTRWFAEAGTDYRDGSSFQRFVGNFHKDAKATLKPEETAALQPLLAAYTPPGARPAKNTGRKPTLIKAWKMTDIEPELARVSKGRNFDKGKQAYELAQCAACHKFGNDGGAIGPDLTAVASRFSRRDILESILEPSKVISEQFQNTIVYLKDGDAIDGRIVEENDKQVVVQTNPLQPEKKTIPKKEIDTRKPSKLSPMPEGLANVLTKDEVLDLIAYLESAGRKDHPDFAK